MKMEKRKFRIGQLAKNLSIKEFVIRFWEKEFSLKPSRSQGKQRFYTESDLEKFSLIKELLYQKKYTLNGAKDVLNKTYYSNKNIIPSKKTTLPENKILNQSLAKNLIHLREQLLKLKKLL